LEYVSNLSEEKKSAIQIGKDPATTQALINIINDAGLPENKENSSKQNNAKRALGIIQLLADNDSECHITNELYKNKCVKPLIAYIKHNLTEK
jgi:hypothetical protein